MAKALGGSGDKGKTNPEELFAAGYGACFQSAMNASAISMKIQMPKAKEVCFLSSWGWSPYNSRIK
jgi:organic hydroperoxide reductase OsmC/OhrA